MPARKASSQTLGRPYRKPTLVGWCKGTKADGGPSVKELGNLTPYLRKKGCPARVRPSLRVKAAAGAARGGRSAAAQATVYQKHRSPRRRKPTYGG